MKFLKNPENIHETLLPVFYLFKMIGLVSFSYRTPVKLGEFKSVYMDVFYTAFLSILHISMHLILYYKTLQNFGELNLGKFLTFAWPVLYHYAVFSKTICILHGFLTRKDSMKFIKLIEEYDRKVLIYEFQSKFYVSQH
jgi:hypothetical protein